MRAIFHVFGFRVLRTLVMQAVNKLPNNLYLRTMSYPLGCTYAQTFRVVVDRMVSTPGLK